MRVKDIYIYIMKKNIGDVSEQRLMLFLVLAIVISLVSVWTVLLSVDFNILEGQTQTQVITIKQSPPASGFGVIGLTILPHPEMNETNITNNGGPQ